MAIQRAVIGLLAVLALLAPYASAQDGSPAEKKAPARAATGPAIPTPAAVAASVPPESALTAPSAVTGASLSTEPTVALGLLDSEPRLVVWRGTRLQVTFAAGSSPSGVGMKSFAISMPQGLALKTRNGRGSSGQAEVLTSAIQLKPGQSREIPPIELVPIPYADLESLLAVLLHRPGKQAIVGTLSYETLSDRAQGTRSIKLVVETKAHPLGMYAGGLAGSILIALFLVLPKVNSPGGAGGAQEAAPALTVGKRFREFLVRFARGAVVTAIAILVFQTTSDFPLPINVAVHDFYGGVVLGLFGDKIGAAMQKWIMG